MAHRLRAPTSGTWATRIGRVSGCRVDGAPAHPRRFDTIARWWSRPVTPPRARRRRSPPPGGRGAAIRLDILGARGSLPATGAAFAQVGGETSCLAITPDGAEAPTLVLDAGTGLRGLGDVLGDRPFRGTLALTHLHWDHVIGLPFADALNRPDARVDLLVPSEGAEPGALLARMMAPPFFPITVSDLAGEIRLEEVAPSVRDAGGLRLEARWVPHGRSRALGFRVSDGGMSIAYLPDHGPAALDGGDGIDPDVLALCRGADVLLHDAQFTAGEEGDALALGHSTAGFAVDLARAAGVGRLLLWHHHPRRTDVEVEAVVAAARAEDVAVAAARQRSPSPGEGGSGGVGR